MVPLADHHWSRASASCRARCSPYRRSEVLRASQLPALLILRQPTYPFPSRSSASSPSAFFSYRFVPYLLFFFIVFIFTRSFGFSDFTVFFFFFFRHFYTCTQISGFYSRIHSFPCVDHIRFRFGVIPETFPNRDVFRFSCVSIFIHILLYRCGGRNGGGTYGFPYFRHMRAVASVDRAYYLRWFLLFALVQFFFFFFPSFGNISQALIGR